MLTGTVPAFNQFSLREVNVSNNALSGPIPNTTVLRSLGASSFAGNPGLCGPPSSTRCHITNNDTTNARPGSAKPSSASTFVIIDVIGLVIVVVLFIIYCRKSRKLKKEKKKGKVVEQEEAEKDVVKSVEVEEKSKSGGEEKGRLRFMNGEAGFELDDLLKASAEGLGKGNFGNCYKATMDDGATMVVRRLRELKPLSRNEFEKHLEAMADLRHPNLLPLVGYYYSREEKLLVYKFASFGNVYDRLHGGRGTRDRIPFRWSARLSVAHAVARALHYLHVNPKSSQPIVPHGNLKSSNVLLGDNDSVLVSDYGLTSLIAIPIAAHRMVAYKSPEYQNYKRVSNKSDVWSYGYLLLELLTGRVSSHAAPQGVNGVDLGGWVHRAVREEWTAEIFDVEIAVQRSANQAMLRLLELAIRCCDKSPERRPEMGEVVREVESVKVVADSEDEDELSSLTNDSVPATPLRS